MTLVRTRFPYDVRVQRPTVVKVETADRLWVVPEGEGGDPPEQPVVWTERPNVKLVTLTRRLNGVDSAKLVHHFGRVRQAGGGAFGDTAELRLEGKFVRLTVTLHEPVEAVPNAEEPVAADPAATRTVVWLGFVERSKRQVVIPHDKSGAEVLTVVGLEWFLGRNRVQSSVLLKTPPAVVDDTPVAHVAVRVFRPRVFNGAPGAERGNRDNQLPLFHNATIDAAAYPHASAYTQQQLDDGAVAYPRDNPERPAAWTGEDIADYLLRWHTPVDAQGEYKPVRYRAEASELVKLAALEPTVRTEGRTLLELLGAVANARRGVAWGSRWDADEGEMRVTFHTLTPEPLDLATGRTLPRNDSRVALDLEGDQSVVSAEVQRVAGRAYTRTRAVGERMTSTFTLSGSDVLAPASLAPRWKIGQGFEYMAGALFDQELAAGADRFSDAVNDKARNRDGEAYRRYGPPADWDGNVAYLDVALPAFPDLDNLPEDLLDPPSSLDVYPPAMELLRTTRIPTGDADGAFAAPRLYVLPRTLGGEYKYADARTEGEPSYRLRKASGLDVFIESTGDAPHTLSVNSLITPQLSSAPEGGWIAAVAPVRSGYDAAVDGEDPVPMGLPTFVNDTEGDPPTFPSEMPAAKLAGNGPHEPGSLHRFYWDGSEWQGFTGWAPTGVQPLGTYFALTLAAEADTYCEGVYDATPAGWPIEELVIDAGPGYRLDYLVKGTILGLTGDGKKILAPESKTLRDDRPALRAIAAASARYYEEAAAEFDFRWSRLHGLLEPGQLVLGFAPTEPVESEDPPDPDAVVEEIGAVVGEVTWDFERLTTSVRSIGAAAPSPEGQLG